MIEDQPAVPRQNGRSPAADFEPLPRRYRSRQAEMRVKQPHLIRFEAVQGHRAIGNPDAFVIEIDEQGLGLAGNFLGTGAGEKRPMNDGQLHLSGMIGNRDGEEAGVLVIHMDEINAIIGFEGSEAQTLPVKQILRCGQRYPWADRGKRRVSHHIALEPFYEGDTRVLATAAALRSKFVIRFRLERDAEPLDSAGIASAVEPDASDADARIVTLRDEPRKEVKTAVRPASGSRIQGAFDFVRITRRRLHHQPQTPQL